jgi:hypothetical protein
VKTMLTSSAPSLSLSLSTSPPPKRLWEFGKYEFSPKIN